MDRAVDYDRIAGEYDKRYERSDYSLITRLLLDFVKGSKHILEVGCGSGHWLKELTKEGYDITGLDPAGKMLQTARKKTNQPLMVQGCAEAVPFHKELFDRVFCINAFHHFTDQERFIKEARRVLVPGGGIFTIGLDPHTGLDSWWIYDYFPQVVEIDKKRYASTDRIRNLMATNGFRNATTMEALHMPVQIPARKSLEMGRLAKSTTSHLTVLTDKEYDEGIRCLMKDIEASEAEDKVLTIGADLRLYATTAWRS